MINRGKTPENILQEEFFREKAVVLGRAGQYVSEAIDKLLQIESIIEQQMDNLKFISDKYKIEPRHNRQLFLLRQKIIKEINEQINQYNKMREYAKLRYYYLIVTREALGLRKHTWVEKFYRISPRKSYLPEE